MGSGGLGPCPGEPPHIIAGRALIALRELYCLHGQLARLEGDHYRLGFWLSKQNEAIFLEGSDPGISFPSTFDPSTRHIYTVVSNTTTGAWPVEVVKEIEAIRTTAV